MKDNGIVVATRGLLADVEVNCLAACQACSAKSLCVGQSQAKGILSAKNDLQAKPGDRVTIDIQEDAYNRSLSILFGSLLLSALAGMTAGYFGASLVPLPAEAGSLIGVVFGIGAGGYWLSRRFRKKTNNRLMPAITKIINKGGQDGQT